jgi:hypothetical protein
MIRLNIVFAFLFCAAGAYDQSVIVNPDGTHSVSTGSVVVNSDGTHSVISGSVIVNPNGTHSIISGSVIVNPDGTHSPVVGAPLITTPIADTPSTVNTMEFGFLDRLFSQDKESPSGQQQARPRVKLRRFKSLTPDSVRPPYLQPLIDLDAKNSSR